MNNKMQCVNLLHFYCYYIIIDWSFLCLRDTQAVYKQGSVHVKGTPCVS